MHLRKKFLILVLTAVMVLNGCGSSGASATTGAEKNQETVSETANETTEKETTEPPKEVKELLVREFDELLAGLPLSVVRTEYVVQDEQYKSLYPPLFFSTIRSASPHNQGPAPRLLYSVSTQWGIRRRAQGRAFFRLPASLREQPRLWTASSL